MSARRWILCGIVLAVAGAGGASALQNDGLGPLNVVAFYVPHCEAFEPPPAPLREDCLSRPRRVRITIRALPSREVIDTIKTERDGRRRKYLPPGEYEVRPHRWNRALRVDVRRVRIVANEPTDIIIEFLSPSRVRRDGGS